jgi:hypothetical protein
MNLYKLLYQVNVSDRLGWKSLPWTNTRILRKLINYGQKSFITLGPGDNTFKAGSNKTVSASKKQDYYEPKK